MIFKNVEFPRCISMGAQVILGWNTALAQTVAGFENANQNWANARNSYDVSLAVRTETDYALVRNHFHSVRGRGFAFPFRDPLDHKVDGSNGILMDRGDSPASTFQLGKRYGTGADAWERRITRPMGDPMPVVYRTRAGVVSVASAVVVLSTGVVTVNGHQAGDTYTWAGRFFTPCRYDTDQLPGVIVDREGGLDGDLLVQCSSIPIVEVRERIE